MKTFSRKEPIPIADYDYPLPEERIAKYPTDKRGESKLLVYRNGNISHRKFNLLGEVLPEHSLLVFNNTKVVRARIVMHKPSGARIELLCLEPHSPSDYERAFAAQGRCRWRCMIGNSKKWKQGQIEIPFEYAGRDEKLTAIRAAEQSTSVADDNLPAGDSESRIEGTDIVEFRWQAPLTFGQLLELLGRMPIPPYLNRDSQQIDNTRYQTVYAKIEGSVAAPTAGLHFTPEIIDSLKAGGVNFEEVTLHVGAGTFLPVKDKDATKHHMHTEHFELDRKTIRNLIENAGHITAVGTTSVRTLESLTVLGWRIRGGSVPNASPIGQWEPYDIPANYTGTDALQDLLAYMTENDLQSIKAATQIMITPLGYRFRIVDNIITNFHQPKSTLLLLIAAYTGEDWHRIYDYALSHDFRFLSYGDSSILIKEKEQ